MAKRPMIRTRPYKPGDEAAFVLRDDFAEERLASDWDWSRGAPGPTWTLHLWGGEVLGIGGAVKEGEAWLCWAQLTEIHRRDVPQLLWLARRVLEHLRVQFGDGIRLEAMTRPSLPAIRCLRRLGFSLFDACEWPGVGLCLRHQRSA